jgi:hypothetical protein
MENGLRAALAAILWVALAGLPAAQNGIPKDTQMNPGGVKPGGGKFIVIGCVSREGTPPAFLVSDSRAKPPAVYRLDGDADLLRLHVGHTVEIGGGITPGGSQPTLKVESLTYISTTCVKLQ